MNQSWNFLDKPEPTFEEWLWDIYCVTPTMLRILCIHAAFYGALKEYDRAMKWYRNRYAVEMEKRRAMTAACPFTDNNSQQQ